MNKELELLYNTAFDLIELRLNKREEIVPFTVTQEQSESKPNIGMYDLSTLNTSEQVDRMRKDLRQKIKTKDLNASCLCFGVRVIDPRTNKETDAVAIELLHHSGESTDIFVPYAFDSDQIIQTPFISK